MIQPSHAPDLGVATSAIRRQGGEGLVVAILGMLGLEDAEGLTRLRASNAAVGVALILDTPSWVASAPPADISPSPSAEARDMLLAAGWRVLEVRRGDALVDLWSEAGMRIAATASRTVVGPTAGAWQAAPGGARR